MQGDDTDYNRVRAARDRIGTLIDHFERLEEGQKLLVLDILEELAGPLSINSAATTHEGVRTLQ